MWIKDFLCPQNKTDKYETLNSALFMGVDGGAGGQDHPFASKLSF